MWNNKTKLREKILRSKELTALEKRYLEELVNASDWIPCSERMPEDYIAVLLYGEKIGILKGFFSPYKDLYIADSGNTAVRKTAVTHWMPLPDKPEVT